jgi:hypothetical protein
VIAFGRHTHHPPPVIDDAGARQPDDCEALLAAIAERRDPIR